MSNQINLVTFADMLVLAEKCGWDYSSAIGCHVNGTSSIEILLETACADCRGLNLAAAKFIEAALSFGEQASNFAPSMRQKILAEMKLALVAKDMELRRVALRALTKFPHALPSSAVQLIAEMLQASDPAVQLESLAALRSQGRDRASLAVPQLIKLCSTELHPSVLEEACALLAGMGSDAIPALKAIVLLACSQHVTAVVSAAVRALAEIDPSGEEVGKYIVKSDRRVRLIKLLAEQGSPARELRLALTRKDVNASFKDDTAQDQKPPRRKAMASSNSEYLTTKDVADKLRVDVGKVLAWINSGELQAMNTTEKPGRKPRWRINLAEFELFRKNRQTQPSAPTAKRQKKRTDGITKYY